RSSSDYFGRGRNAAQDHSYLLQVDPDWLVLIAAALWDWVLPPTSEPVPNVRLQKPKLQRRPAAGTRGWGDWARGTGPGAQAQSTSDILGLLVEGSFIIATNELDHGGHLRVSV